MRFEAAAYLTGQVVLPRCGREETEVLQQAVRSFLRYRKVAVSMSDTFPVAGQLQLT